MFLHDFFTTTAQIPTLAINKLIPELVTLETYQCNAEVYRASEPEPGSVLK